MNEDDLKFLTAQGEGYRLEFKESYSDAIGKEICAFVNSGGGKLLLGVTDDGSIKGLKSTNQLKSRIYDLTRNFDPPLTINIEDVGSILVVTVDEGFNKPYSVNGRFYMRYGANSQQLKRDEIRDLFREENLIRFDSQVNRRFDIGKDLDEVTFRRFVEITKISRVIKRERIIENLGLLKDGSITNTGVLLFCSKVTSFFLNATISCFLYMGNHKYKILDRREFDRDIYSNYQEAITYLRSHLNTEYIIKGGPREEKLELPEEALREAILNAIAHRDYFSAANIHVNIFKDRVQIVNPGGLAGNLTIDDIYQRSIPRNPLLFGLMERMELVEKAGSGLVRIENAMAKYRLERPVIDADKNWFQITFTRPDLQVSTYEDRIKMPVPEYRALGTPGSMEVFTPATAPGYAPPGLSELQTDIIRLLKSDRHLTYDQLAQTLKMSRSTIGRNIYKLKRFNILRREGAARNGHWIVLF